MGNLFSSQVTKTVYIGAGMDDKRLNEMFYYPNTSNIEIIMIDLLPFNTPDLVEYCIKNGHPYENMKWLDEMIEKFTSFDGCKMISHDTDINLIVFEYIHKNGITITIKYYYASPFPEILDVDKCHSVYNPSIKKKEAILSDITGYNVLYIDGFIPHNSILQYASEIIDISGSTGTRYGLLEDDHKDNYVFYDKINQMVKSGRIRNWSYLKLFFNKTTGDYEYIKTITRKATLDNIFQFNKTAVYIGAGICIDEFPGFYLSEHDEFICIDQTPKDNSMNMDMTDVDTLKNSFIDHGCTLIYEKVDIDLLVFTKTIEEGKTITIKYYHSTCFPFDEKKDNDDKIKTIEMDIRGYNALICHNYTPHSSIFKYSDGFDLFLSSMDYLGNIKDYVHSLIGEDNLYNLDNIVIMMYQDEVNSSNETEFVFQKNIYEKAIYYFSK